MPVKKAIKTVSHITVEHFFSTYGEKLDLKLANFHATPCTPGSNCGLDNHIHEPAINRPGLALTGFSSYFANKRVQVFGSAEISYMRSLPEKTREEKMALLFRKKIPCLVFSRNYNIPKYILTLADKHRVPVFRTSMITMHFVNAATIAMEAEFSPTTNEHGSMVEIQGMGTLIRGTSGIGKSECVLSLINHGYSLVSDDVTKFRVFEGRRLMGSAPDLTRFLMEVRGIGLINVASVFGIGSVRQEKKLDFVVSLKDWDEVEHIERVGLTEETYEILGVKVPHVTIPVRPGRDVARLVEVAAYDRKLKSLGANSALEFNQRLLQKLGQPKI